MISKKLIGASYKPLVLSLLANGEAYGYEIIQRVEQLSDGDIRWTAGTLYPLLHDLETEEHITATWRESESGRERKYYRITEKGLNALAGIQREWLDLNGILENLWRQAPGLSPA